MNPIIEMRFMKYAPEKIRNIPEGVELKLKGSKVIRRKNRIKFFSITPRYAKSDLAAFIKNYVDNEANVIALIGNDDNLKRRVRFGLLDKNPKNRFISRVRNKSALIGSFFEMLATISLALGPGLKSEPQVGPPSKAVKKNRTRLLKSEHNKKIFYLTQIRRLTSPRLKALASSAAPAVVYSKPKVRHPGQTPRFIR